MRRDFKFNNLSVTLFKEGEDRIGVVLSGQDFKKSFIIPKGMMGTLGTILERESKEYESGRITPNNDLAKLDDQNTSNSPGNRPDNWSLGYLGLDF